MKKYTVSEMHRLTADEYRRAAKVPVVAVLDNVRSRHNIGAVFRTADAFRLEQVCLCGICACPPDAEIHKTALGAEQTVPWQFFQTTEDAVGYWRERGFLVYAVEQAYGSKTPEEVMQRLSSGEMKGIAVVFGHEVFGVQQQVVDAADGCIEIPQYGTKHSLNVSVAAGIVLYALSSVYKNQL